MARPAIVQPVPLLLLTAIAAVVIGYWPTTASLLERWLRFDEAYGHGLLIASLSLWLIWQRSQHHLPSPRFQPPGLVLIAGAGALWLIAYLTDIEIIQQLMWPLLMLVAAYTLLGAPACKPFAFPLLFLYFAIPIWDYFNDVALAITLAVVTNLFDQLHIPTVIEGNTVTIPYGRLMVADGCSGLRYFIIGIALACYVAFSEPLHNSRRLALLVAGALLGLLSNWVRVITLILIGYYTEMESTLMKDHEYFGWGMFFVLVLLPLLGLTHWLTRNGPGPSARSTEPPPGKQAGIKPWQVLVTVAALSLPPLLGAWINSRPAPSVATAPEELALSGWRQSAPAPWQPPLPEPKAQLVQSPIAPQFSDWTLYRYRYLRGPHNREIYPYIASLYNKKRWAKLSTSDRQLVFHGDTVSAVETQYADKTSNDRWLVLHWFAVDGDTSASVNMIKLLQIKAILSGVYHGDYYALAARCETDCSERSGQLAALLAALGNTTEDARPPQ